MGGEKSLNFNYMKYADQIFIGFFTPKLCHQLSKMGAKLFKNITKQKKKKAKVVLMVGLLTEGCCEC